MSFRDSFADGYSLRVVGPREVTHAQRSLEYTIDSGFSTTSRNLEVLNKELVSTFEDGVAQLAESNTNLAEVLQAEIQFQTDQITEAVYQGSQEVVEALGKACDYLGGKLWQIRWAIERQTEVSERILKLLLGALDHTSRQYWEQGVKCYDTGEYEFAQERFNRALDANRTNYFAYEYLGFIAIHHDDSHIAIQNFELARKFADSGYHRALALSHLARCHHALGDLSVAVRCAATATESCPDHARFWYECAVYRVREQNSEEAIRCLRNAISTDWTYWSISASDANLDAIRDLVYQLLGQMREESRARAWSTLDDLGSSLRMLHGMGLDGEIQEHTGVLGHERTVYDQGTVFAYRDLVPRTKKAHESALQAAIDALEQRTAENRSDVQELGASESRKVLEAQQAASAASQQAAKTKQENEGKVGCSVVFALVVGAMLLMTFYQILTQPMNPPNGKRFGFELLSPFALWLTIASIYAAVKISKVSGARNLANQHVKWVDQVRRGSEASIAQGTAELNTQLSILTRNQAVCQEKLKMLVDSSN